MTSRRGFLGALLGAAVLDPDRLLWRPGAKLVSVPRPLIDFEARYITPAAIALADSIDMELIRWMRAQYFIQAEAILLAPRAPWIGIGPRCD